MRILHVINSANPAGGGPIEAIIQADRALRAEGHICEMVCMDNPAAAWLQTMPLPTHPMGPAKGKYRRAPRFIPWLREHRKNYDCVIVHGIWLFPSAGTRRALYKTDTPYFIYTHGMMDPVFRTLFPLKHVLKTVWWKLREHRVMRDARAVFFTCEEERRLAQNSFKPFVCESAIVPYCVGEPPGDPELQKNLFLETFPQLTGHRFILFLSRIHKKKGCDLLLKAFSRIKDRDDGLYLVMAGPDSTGWRKDLKEEAEALGIADRVIWTGMLSGDTKWGAFRAADVFALPSHQENFGIAVTEALACSLPVIVTDRVNIWREIQEDRAGIIIQPETDKTAEGFNTWLNMGTEEQDQMRKNAARCFAKRFRADIAAKNLLNVLMDFGVKG